MGSVSRRCRRVEGGYSGWWRRHIFGIGAAAITVLALGLRIWRLDAKGLWLDEILTAQAAQHGSLAGVLSSVHDWDLSMPPLSFLLTWAARAVLGGTDFAVRFPEALAGAATVPAVYFLGKELFGPRVGVAAALLTAILPFSVWYGQEARPYALFMLFTTLQMFLAYRTTATFTISRWMWFVVFSVANLYTHYLAIPVTFAAYVFMSIVSVSDSVRARTGMRGPRTSPRPAPRWIALGAGVTLIACSPWMHEFVAFLRRPDLGLGRAATSVSAPGARSLRVLSELSFGGPLLPLLVIGVVALIARMLRGPSLPSLLIVMWIGLPLLSLVLLGGLGIVTQPPRYWSFLFPAGVIVGAVGIEATALFLGRLIRLPHGASPGGSGDQEGSLGASGASPTASLVATLTYVGLVLATVVYFIPRLAAEYQSPKDEYRMAAAHIVQSATPDATVVALGPYSTFAVLGLTYYLTRAKAPVKVLDGGLIDDQFVDRVRGTKGPLWAAVAHLPLRGALEEDFHLERFTGVTLLKHAESGREPVRETEALLGWASKFHTPHSIGSTIFRALASGDAGRRNLLPSPDEASSRSTQPIDDRWLLMPGGNIEQDAFRLDPRGSEINVTFRTEKLRPGDTYIFQFSYRNRDLHGKQRAYVSAHRADGGWLAIFPTGAGYPCRTAPEWTSGAFGFSVPSEATSAVIWLRASGTGAAEFRAVTLSST